MEQCFNEECIYHISQHGGTCKGLKEHEKCHLFTALKANKKPVENVLCSDRVMPRFMDKMHIDFERYVSSNLNWPIERTGSAYHDKRTDGAWKVFKFAKVA